MNLVETNGNVSIVPTTFEALSTEDRGGAALAESLGVLPPPSWPPEHNGPETREWIRGIMRKHPDEPGFSS